MRVVWLRGLALVGILSLLGCADAEKRVGRLPAENGCLVLATTLGSPPYAYCDKATGEIRGIDIDFARAAAKKLGRKLEVRPMLFSLLLPSVKAGTADFAAAAITITPARARDVDFTEPYAYDGSAFLYRTGETRPTAALGNAIRIGTQETSSSQFFLSDHGIDSISYPEFDDALADFEKGLLDAVFYDAEPIRVVVAKSSGAYSMTPLFTRENYGLAVRKDFPELLAALNEIIRSRKSAK